MLFRLAAKALWGSTKFTIKHVVVPIAITAATAVVLDEISKRMRESDKQRRATHNGRVEVLKPKP